MVKQGEVTTMVTCGVNEVERYVVTDRMKLEIIFSSYYYIILQQGIFKCFLTFVQRTICGGFGRTCSSNARDHLEYACYSNYLLSLY